MNIFSVLCISREHILSFHIIHAAFQISIYSKKSFTKHFPYPNASACIFRLLKRESTPILAKTDDVTGILLYRDMDANQPAKRL